MNTATMAKKWLTRTEAAEVYSVSVDFLDQLRAQGLITAKPIGSRRINLSAASIDAYFDSLEDA